MNRAMATDTVKIQKRHSVGRDEPILRKAPSLCANCNLTVSPNSLITESGSIKFLAANLLVWSQPMQSTDTNNIKIILLIRENIKYLLTFLEIKIYIQKYDIVAYQ